MAVSTHVLTQLRRYSGGIPRDPQSRLKVSLMTGYVVAALALPFVPPVLQTRKTRADGSYLTRPQIEFVPAPKY